MPERYYFMESFHLPRKPHWTDKFKNRNFRSILPVVLVIMLAIAIPVTLVLTEQRQDLRQQAAPGDPNQLKVQLFIFKKIYTCGFRPFNFGDRNTVNNPNQCYHLALSDAETQQMRTNANQSISKINQWSNGKMNVTLDIVEIPEEQNITFTIGTIGETGYIAPENVRTILKSRVDTNTDMIVIGNPQIDPTLRFTNAQTQNPNWDTATKYPDKWGIENPACEYFFGNSTIKGAPVFWWPQTCAGELSFIHGFLHGMNFIMHDVTKYPDIYKSQLVGDSKYPSALCGNTDPDKTKWYPDPHADITDPDFRYNNELTCQKYTIQTAGKFCDDVAQPGDPSPDWNCSIAWYGHILSTHLPIFTQDKPLIGNHCRNGVKDFNETGVDSGPVCLGDVTGQLPPPPTPTPILPPCRSLGDLFVDGAITSDDTFLLQALVNKVNPTASELEKGDLTADNKITQADVDLLSQYSNGSNIIIPACAQRPLFCPGAGDINNDGVITIADVRLLAGNLTPEQVQAGDVNVSGGVNQDDINLMSQYLGGNNTPFAVCTRRPLKCGNFGDLNADGVITNADDILLLKYTLGQLSGTQKQRVELYGDLNSDNAITAADRLEILRYITNPNSNFKICVQKYLVCSPYGDFDSNGFLNHLDYEALLKHLNGTAPFNPIIKLRADFDKNGIVNQNDAKIMTDVIAGHATTFPACQ